MTRITRQHGYILLPVVIMLTLVATVAFMLNNESALDSGITSSQLEPKQADYVARAGLNHGLWQVRQQGCGPYTDLSNQPLNSHRYTTTLTTGLGSTIAYTISVDQDTWIRSDQPTNNYASDSKLHIRFETGIIERPMYRYDVSPIPADSSILSATAWFYVSAAHPEGPVDIHLLNADWTETDATWDSMGANMDPEVQATIPTQPVPDVWVPVNLTAQVQAWVKGSANFGITLNSVSEGTHGDYASIETTQKPYLEVIVGTPPSTPTRLKSKATMANGITRTINLQNVGLYQQPSHLFLQPDSVTGKDAWLTEDKTTWNYGKAGFLRVRAGGGGHWRSPIQFDLGRVPYGAKIRSATLELYRYSGTQDAAGLINVHAITDSWVEGDSSGGTGPGVTWDQRDLGLPWNTAGGDYDAAPSASIQIDASADTWFSADVTSLVQQWVNASSDNHGMVLMAGDNGVRAEFKSSDEADPTLRPKLTIRYACECGSPCLTPQGSGTVLMVVINPTTLVPIDAYKKALFESWGYAVSVVGESSNQSTYDAGIAAADVVFISETVNANQVGTKLANAPIGVVSQDGIYNDDLDIATGSAFTVASAINVTDTSHYITAVFPPGPMEIYSGAMEQLTVSGSTGPELQALADTDGAGSLVAIDTGAIGTGGTPLAGRRVMLPLGTDTSFKWDYLNGNGRLIVQRALQWGTGNIGAPPPKLLFVAASLTPTAQEQLRIDLIESWGYAVNLIDDNDSQANFDAAIAANDVAYVSSLATETALGTKLKAANIGVVNEQGALVDEFGFGQQSVNYKSRNEIDVLNNTHYITEPFATGLLTIVSVDQSLHIMTANKAPGFDALAQVFNTGSLWDDSLGVIETGGELFGGGTAAGRRVLLPWGDNTFDVAALNTDGLTIMQRAIEWAGGAGCGTTKFLLMLVGDAANPTVEELSRQTLLESWCYSVSTVTASEPQATYDTFADTYDVVYVPASVNYADVASKLKLQPVGVVNEVGTLTAYLGFTSGTSGYTGTVTELTDNTHYITTGLTLGNLAITTTSTSLRTFVNTMGPGFRTLSTRPSYTDPMIMILDTGDELLWGGNAPDRRVMLPWGGSSTFDPNNLTTDGQTILRRALDWAAGAEPASAPTYNVLMIVGNLTLSSKDTGYKALMESWGHTVSLIDDGDSQANYDTAMAAADVIYASGSASGPSILDKPTNTPKGLVNEVNGKIDNFGFSSVTSSTANFDTFSKTDAVHYITEPFAGNPVTVFTSSLTNPVPGGTLAPDMQNVAEVSGTLALGTLDTGATRYDSNPSQGRRVHLPFTAAETTDMTADGKTILQRAIEWAAGAGNGGGGGGPGPGSCDGTYRDEFSLRQYDQNNGTLSWATNWQETGETTDPTGGDIRIDNDVSNYQLQVRDDGQTVWREADLSGAGSATLSFEYRRENLSGSGDYVAVEVSYNGGSNWTELERFTGTATDTAYASTSYVLDAGSLSANTRIRFLTPGNGMGNSNMVWFDNIQIQCSP